MKRDKKLHCATGAGLRKRKNAESKDGVDTTIERISHAEVILVRVACLLGIGFYVTRMVFHELNTFSGELGHVWKVVTAMLGA